MTNKRNSQVSGILVPELNRYYVAVNHHGETPAEV